MAAARQSDVNPGVGEKGEEGKKGKEGGRELGHWPTQCPLHSMGYPEGHLKTLPFALSRVGTGVDRKRPWKRKN